MFSPSYRPTLKFLSFQQMIQNAASSSGRDSTSTALETEVTEIKGDSPDEGVPRKRKAPQETLPRKRVHYDSSDDMSTDDTQEFYEMDTEPLPSEGTLSQLIL